MAATACSAAAVTLAASSALACSTMCSAQRKPPRIRQTAAVAKKIP
ncbi:hypothetical protein ACFQQB_66545 [Nonomuraea rubra]